YRDSKFIKEEVFPVLKEAADKTTEAITLLQF
ncbi:MAG: hypothetical protein ACJAWW_002515, partial [Sulfurimonas sp.]